MKFAQYKHAEIEPAILDYWYQAKSVEKLRKRNNQGKKFYFLEGPPYTSGHIHLGHAWNMALKDIVLRYKRMQGYNVWDRMGYDMHGLPTEQKVMTKFNLKNKQDIEQFGIKRFTKECETFCVEMMHKMNEDFQRLGATLDFSNPYQPISKEFIEAEWWLIKKTHEKGRLYRGLRTMHWDAATQTAVAKHELEYKEIKDTAIFVKFPHAEKANTFFIIWTTTPWTIPLNLAIMVNPELTYVELLVNGNETWIIAKDLVAEVVTKNKVKTQHVKREFLGSELEGQQYNHPLQTKKNLSPELQKNPRLFSILLSKEYVDATSGTGLVHCAPGCGPEDYEVAHRYKIPPFNCVNEEGYFENFGQLSGLKAKKDDIEFIQKIKEAGALLATESYIHEYPHGERSHEPVIFRTTSQWFFRVEDLKSKMLTANDKISWVPTAAKNAFSSWLENLRDNSITKQRYWGTPVPIWHCAETDDFIVISSVGELEKISGKKIKGLHIPEIDQITITKKGKVYKRIPDVLDVWIDAGTASWNCLDYPQKKKNFEKLFPADFILEGKDQIRGWFNLLMIASMLAFEKPPFTHVYMNGFVTDVNGVKMSKSQGNIISPYELIDKYGADTLRYYHAQTSAGEDINFSWDECSTKARYLTILWNIHQLLINLSKETGINPFHAKQKKTKMADPEEKYILSKLHHTIQKTTTLLNNYHIDESIAPIEELFLELSRTYIQMVREKSTSGSQTEKEAVVQTMGLVLLETLKMFQLIAPFICEAIYLNLKEEFGLTEASISHYFWPKVEKAKINPKLEQEIKIIQEFITAAATAREKAHLGLRWPVKEIRIISNNPTVRETIKFLPEILKKQTNAKTIICEESMPGIKLHLQPDPRKIGPRYGKLSSSIIKHLMDLSPENLLNAFKKEGIYKTSIEGQPINITPEMVNCSSEAPSGYINAETKYGILYLCIERNLELEAEGYGRELTRAIQDQRKKAGLQKTDTITLYIKTSSSLQKMIQPLSSDIQEKVGAISIILSPEEAKQKYQYSSEFTIKNEKINALFNKK